MPLTKQQKEEIVKNLSNQLAKEKATVFFDFTGLNFNRLQKLRRELKEKGINLQIIKKTLLKLALKNANRDVPVEKFTGSVAVANSDNDELLPSKVIYNFSRANEAVKILGGILERKFINREEMIKIAKLPSKEQLLSNFINLLQNNIRSMIYLLTQIHGRKI